MGADSRADGSVDGAMAGVVTRSVAAAVDVAVVVLVAVLLDLGAAGVRFAASPVDFRWPEPSPGLTVGVLLAVAVAYLAAGWAMAGRTYGERLLGLRVLSTRRELLGWMRSIVRAAVCVVWPIGLLWCAVDRRRASVADLVVRSVVVYDTHPYARVPHLQPAGAAPR
jgi:uncharacterized RDD family membrane protein YckC